MVYGYARVSTRGQAKDGNSLEAQENAYGQQEQLRYMLMRLLVQGQNALN